MYQFKLPKPYNNNRNRKKIIHDGGGLCGEWEIVIYSFKSENNNK